MGERPDEVRRRDPLDEGRTTDPGPVPGETGFDPATGAFEPDAVNPDPDALRAEAAADEAELTRAEIERTRAEIERTRADMGETVDAIQGRLSPENLKEQAKDRVKEATVGRAQGAGSTIMETIRANPVPAALTGIGLGWLLMSAGRQSSDQLRYRDRAYDSYDYPSPYEERGSSVPSAGQALDRAQSRVGESASRARDTVEEGAGQVQERAGQVAGQAQDQVSRLGDQARYQAQRASGGFQRMLRENPLAVGALAVGAGAAVGLAIPETSQEHEVMGEARDTFVQKAQEKAQEAQQKVQRVAEEAQSAAEEEAENQGLTNQ